MKAIYDHEIINLNDFRIDHDDRSFQYGDGLFETMVTENQKVCLIKYHFHRIVDGLRVLNLRVPGNFSISGIREMIKNVLEINEFWQEARIKLIIWREKGGYYEPLSEKAHFLIYAKHFTPDKNKLIDKVDFCESVQNYYSPYSFFKRQSSLHYVLAGLEKRSKQISDLILLDNEGHISEMLYSNIFWVKDRQFYTPPLDTGCIRGVMRSYLLETLPQKGYPVKEVKSTEHDLLRADYIFSANVTGLSPVVNIKDIPFNIYPGLNSFLPKQQRQP